MQDINFCPKSQFDNSTILNETFSTCDLFKDSARMKAGSSSSNSCFITEFKFECDDYFAPRHCGTPLNGKYHWIIVENLGPGNTCVPEFLGSGAGTLSDQYPDCDTAYKEIRAKYAEDLNRVDNSEFCAKFKTIRPLDAGLLLVGVALASLALWKGYRRLYPAAKAESEVVVPSQKLTPAEPLQVQLEAADKGATPEQQVAEASEVAPVTAVNPEQQSEGTVAQPAETAAAAED